MSFFRIVQFLYFDTCLISQSPKGTFSLLDSHRLQSVWLPLCQWTLVRKWPVGTCVWTPSAQECFLLFRFPSDVAPRLGCWKQGSFVRCSRFHVFPLCLFATKQPFLGQNPKAALFLCEVGLCPHRSNAQVSPHGPHNLCLTSSLLHSLSSCLSRTPLFPLCWVCWAGGRGDITQRRPVWAFVLQDELKIPILPEVFWFLNVVLNLVVLSKYSKIIRW